MLWSKPCEQRNILSTVVADAVVARPRERHAGHVVLGPADEVIRPHRGEQVLPVGVVHRVLPELILEPGPLLFIGFFNAAWVQSASDFQLPVGTCETEIRCKC